MEEGLSDYNINNFFQDSRGIMWISTQYGLNRFDGTSIKVYMGKELGLPEDWISDIAEDANQKLWITSNSLTYIRSISVFDPITEKAMSVEEYTGAPYPFNSRYKLLMSPAHNDINILRGRKGDLIKFYNLEKGQLKLAFEIKKDALTSSVMDGYKLSRDTFLLQLSDDKIAYANNSGEILSLTDQDDSFDNRIDFLKSNKVGRKALNKIISTNNIKYSFDGDTLKTYSASGQLVGKKIPPVEIINNENIKNISFADIDGNLWFVSHQRSFCILSLKKQKFSIEAFDESVPFKTRGIVRTSNGTIYAVGYSSLRNEKTAVLYQKTSESAKIKNNFPGAFGILEGDADNLWSGGYGGLKQYNTKNQTYQTYKSNTAWQLYKSPGGDIWIGNEIGLSRFDTIKNQVIKFSDYSTFPILQNSIVYAFYTNEKGTWLSTSAGLFLVDLEQEKILEYYSENQEGDFFIPSSHIAHIHEDQAGIFWLATKGDGLIRWDPKTKTSEVFSKANTGLSHDVLYAVYEDDFDNLWIPSSWGLMCFNKTKRLVTTYFEEDGIPNNEFNTISHHRDQEGNLYFGTQNGFIHFHPKDFKQVKTEHPFIISACSKELLKNDSIINLTASVLESHKITLFPKDKLINLNLALLDYQNIKGIQYSYKIEGYHEDWIYQKEPTLQLIGLPYGSYQLLLRAKTGGSHLWQEYAQPIGILVKKPFYLEWWFVAGSILALGISLFLLYKRRVKLYEERQKRLEVEIENATEQIVQDKEKIEAQNEELRGMDQVKSNFFANISHELRTPLTLILGPLSYVLDSPDDLNKERVQQQLRVMQRNGKSLLQLIEEILDLSKLEANKLNLEEEATSVYQFFEQIFWMFEPQFQSQGLDYELIFNLKDEDLHVLLDRKKMEKVLNNYLSNAIKFTPKGNKITLTITETNTLLNIQVSDTGKGVHPNDLPHIFERFYQSKQDEQKLYGGTGIGLALVNEFAHLMGGKAYAESTMGSGSQFYFELPKKVVSVNNIISKWKVAKPNIEIEEEPIESIGTDFTILVVEDNEDMRNFVCGLLETRYKKILQAANGAEGLEQLNKHGLDIRLVISDIMMPEVDGLSMLKEIKGNNQWAGIPVIMLTALSSERDKLAALTIGVDDYLTKPFSVTELLARVQNLLYNYHQREKWQNSPEYLSECEKDSTIIDASQTSVLDKKWVSEIEELIKGSFFTEIPNRESLAASVNLSLRQFTRKLKAATGLSPAKFIKEVQLQKARKELENGRAISIKEVAFNNGFGDPNTFSKVFKTRFGKSPSEYLKKVG